MENGVKNAAQSPLGWCKAGSFGVSAVAQQSQYAFFPDFCKTLQIYGITEYRCIIHFKVPCMNNGARRGVNSESCRIHNTVVCLNEFNPELAQINGLAEFDNLPLGMIQKVVLLELVFDNSHRQTGGINGDIQLL